MMTVFTIIALVCIVGLGWHWLNKKPVLKGSPARAWPNRVKPAAKRKFVVPF